MKSIWQNVTLPEFPKAEGNFSADVLIIGGGAAGILCAYYLKQNGIDCILVEKDRICSGVTGNTTAKITAQHGFIYRKIADTYGIETAAKYYIANSDAIKEYEKLAENFNCDFLYNDNYVYTLDDPRKAETELEIMQKIGFNAEFTDSMQLPFKVAGVVKTNNQAQFHPLKFFCEVAKGLPIYENTWIKEMIGNTAVTDNGKIKAKAVIVATHYPFINKHGNYFLKMYQHRSYVIALKNAQVLDGMYVDESDYGLSFRNYGEYLLLGGGGARTGKPCGGWDELRKFAKINYHGYKEVNAYATQDCITLDGMPYIGKYSENSHNLYVATGFNKWGMTGSMAAAKILSDMLTGKENDYAEIFNPSRSIIHKQLFINGIEATAKLLTFSKKRCPHLGCALKWNKYEHSWDCSCHGSRFSDKGKLLNNPANGDLKM